MEQYQLESVLLIITVLIAAASLITTICGAVAWTHWEDVMDKCPYSDWYRAHENCGCVLYGKKYDSGFRGGAISNCYFVTFAPLLITLLMSILVGYHFIRIVINKKGKPNNNMIVERRDGEVVVTTTTPSVRGDDGGNRKVWLAFCITAAILTLYSMSYAFLLTDGYYKTCEQYRIDVSKEFSAFGNQQAVIYKRLACSAIYDFMDYLFPNYNTYTRDYYINTAVTLTLAIQTAWITTILMALTSIFYFKIAQLNRMHINGK